MIIDISKESPYYEFLIFNGGEPHVKLDPKQNWRKVTIKCQATSTDNLMKALLAKDAIERIGYHKTEVHLWIPYFPAARQDRVMVKGEPLSVKIYADIINQAKFDSVYIYDPHSDVAPALLNDVIIEDNHLFIRTALQEIARNKITIISPDAGSNKKAVKLVKYLQGFDNADISLVKCDKVRNVATGKLTGFEVYAGSLEGRHCLLVDDICDGGGTFLGLGEKLREKGCTKLYLAISHGIFSKDLGGLAKIFDRIFTTNSIQHGWEFRERNSQYLDKLSIFQL